MKPQPFSPKAKHLEKCFLAIFLAILFFFPSEVKAYYSFDKSISGGQENNLEYFKTIKIPSKPMQDNQNEQFGSQSQKESPFPEITENVKNINLNIVQTFTSPALKPPNDKRELSDRSKHLLKELVENNQPINHPNSPLFSSNPPNNPTSVPTQQPVAASNRQTINLDYLFDNSQLQLHSNAITQEQIDNARRWKMFASLNILETNDEHKNEANYYEQKYKIGSYKELPFCIVVPTYNNAADDRYLLNIRSILMQNYTNFHIVVFDDASTDKTGELISSFLEKQTKVPKQRYQVQRNEQQMKAMYNLRRAAMEFCKPLQIFLIVDGDDELLGRQVLKVFNAYFQKEEAWFVYSNSLFSNVLAVGYSRPFPQRTIQSNTYRYYPFVTSHLRAFYTLLFRNIKDQDLKDEDGEYFKAANDVAICIPCLQQAHKKVSYLPELTYYYNSDTGQNNHVIRALEQRSNSRKIRRKPHYKPLQKLLEIS